MYHAHMDDGWQLAGGIDGALIVLPPHEALDPQTDHIVLISESYERAGSPYVAFNGDALRDIAAQFMALAQK